MWSCKSLQCCLPLLINKIRNKFKNHPRNIFCCCDECSVTSLYKIILSVNAKNYFLFLRGGKTLLMQGGWIRWGPVVSTNLAHFVWFHEKESCDIIFSELYGEEPGQNFSEKLTEKEAGLFLVMAPFESCFLVFFFLCFSFLNRNKIKALKILFG